MRISDWSSDVCSSDLVAATITAHHLLYNRNALFQGGIRPHWYCLPVLKRETHRQALIDAATSQSDRFFLGTDSAPHPKGLKEHACGCARSEEHTSELQSLMRISYAVFCLKKKKSRRIVYDLR